jgi:hypothetical protein
VGAGREHLLRHPLRADQSLIVLDTSDVNVPRLIPCAQGSFGCAFNGFFLAPPPLNPRFDDLEFSKDGNIAYVAVLGVGLTSATNGLLILDVSDFQLRRVNPAVRVIGSVNWDDGSIGAQNALAITVASKPYVLLTDSAGAQAAGCTQGKSANGFPRLIDVGDPARPAVASKLMLEVADPANCSTIVAGAPILPTAIPFGYSCSYCSVDDVNDAHLAACSCFAAGLRVFDIHEPSAPREVAYFKPPAQGTRALPASQYASLAPASFSREFDWTTAKASWPRDRGSTSGDIWLTSHDNGFLVVRLDPSVLPDTTPPVISATTSPAANGHGWNNTPVEVVLSASDEAGGSGVRSIAYAMSGAQTDAAVVDAAIVRLRVDNDGMTTVTFFATDRAGNSGASQEVVVRVDFAVPAITGLPANCVLWPPDHRLVHVADVAVADAMSGVDASSFRLDVTSSEPAAGDILVSGGAVSLRAERSGGGTGRDYDFMASVSDLAGNVATALATCSVPHDQGR